MLNRTITILVFSFVVSSLSAQSYVGKQRSFALGTQEMMQVFNGQGDLEKASAYYFKMTFPEALKAIKAKGINPSVEEGKIYVESKKFRFDTQDEGEKITMIMDLETNKMYTVNWVKKEYMEIDIEKMNKMREQMQSKMAEQMQGMGTYLDKLPPETRKKIEAMQKGQMPGMDSGEAKVSATGKSKTINGFKCKEYIVRKDNQTEQIWASTQYPELMKMFKEMESSMGEKESLKSTIWEKIAGWPVQQTEVEMNMMRGQGRVNYDEVYSIEKVTHAPGTFSPPAGFKKTTMEEKMREGLKGFSPGN